MVLYHVFIEHYVEGGTEKTSGLFANLNEKMVEVNFTEPYNNGESFDWFDVTIDRVIVTRIHVFCSSKNIHQLLLPDGKSAAKSEPNTTASSFLSGDVPDIFDATADFVKPSTTNAAYSPAYRPKEKKKKVWTPRLEPRDRRIY
jgi:hypothetical protein